MLKKPKGFVPGKREAQAGMAASLNTLCELCHTVEDQTNRTIVEPLEEMRAKIFARATNPQMKL